MEMKAIVQQRYGPASEVLRVEEVAKPAVGDGDVLIAVRAAGVNPLDWHYVTGKPYVARMAMGRPMPKITVRGVDVAGRVEAAGPKVKTFKPGDDVFGWVDGSFAEFASAPEDHFVRKPDGMTYEEAAAVPIAAFTALQGLRDTAEMQAGQRVLINGASGGVGIYAVQIAKALGAEVTGVCSTRNVEMVRSLGADTVVDYTRDDFTKGGGRYDIIFDNAGSQPFSALRRTLRPGGRIVYNSGTPFPRMMGALVMSRLGRTIRTFLAQPNHEDLTLIASLIESGKLRSVIDRTYPLQETAAAVAYVEAGHARGKVVITAA